MSIQCQCARRVDVCILEPQPKVLILGVVSEANAFSLGQSGGESVPPCLGGLEVVRYRMCCLVPQQVIQYEKTSLTGPLLWDAGCMLYIRKALRVLREEAETLQMRCAPFCLMIATKFGVGEAEILSSKLYGLVV